MGHPLSCDLRDRALAAVDAGLSRRGAASYGDTVGNRSSLRVLKLVVRQAWDNDARKSGHRWSSPG
jgi:hypothetical protein